MGKLLIDLKNSEQEPIFHHLIKNTKVCVVDFYADWCGPCVKLGKVLEEKLPSHEKLMKNILKPDDDLSSNDLQDKIAIIKIDIESFQDLAGTYKVSSIPHVIFYKNGELQSGLERSCDGVLNKINKLLS